MPEIETLLSLCEIAAALAGFAAIVTVISPGTSPESWVRLQSVVLICLLVVSASLVPILLENYGFSERVLFGVSATIFFVLIWLTIFTISGFARKIGKSLWTNVGGLSSNVLLWSMEALIQVPLILCIIGVLPQYYSAFYMTALIVNLLQAAQFFYMLVVEVKVDAT